MWRWHADVGYESKVCLILPGWCLSTRLRSAPTWRGSGDVPPRGVRVIGIVPLGTWETITFVAALRHNKMTAPMVIEGAMTGEMFLAYVEQCLVPTLRRIDIVVMDRAVLQRAGACRSASRVHLRFGDPKSLRSKRPSTKPSASAFGHGTSTYMRYNRAATHDHG
jgi:hypothetical protein